MRRPSGGGGGAGAAWARLRLRWRAAVGRVLLEAGDLQSPPENGRWNTVPAG